MIYDDKCKVTCIDIEDGKKTVDAVHMYTCFHDADGYAFNYVHFHPNGRARVDVCDRDGRYESSYAYLRTENRTFNGDRVIKRVEIQKGDDIFSVS